MKVKFTVEDPASIKRLAKAEDMAQFIWELVHNGWREFKHTDYDYEPAWKKINELLEEYYINPDELID